MLIEKVGNSPSLQSQEEMDEPDDSEQEEFSENDLLGLLMGEFQVLWRQEAEDVLMRPNTRLKTALNKLPSHWLQGICQQIGLEELKNRKERLLKLAKVLPESQTLERIWRPLPESSREVLRWILLKREGWATIQHLSRKFGRDTDTTWWWNEGQTPKTPLGLLRVFGLIYVGKTKYGKRRMRIATIPVELRKPLKRILRDPALAEMCDAC